jgi:hypothetical protein
MNRASLAIFLGTLLGGGGGGSTPRGARAEFPGRDLAQGSEESVSLVRGTALPVELDTPVDSKKVKTGDAVNAHVTEAVKANGQTVIPKNTKLVGHVTQASARAKGDAGSALAIVFDKAVPKKGPEVPLRVVIQAMAAAPRFTPDAGPDVAAINNGGAAAEGSPMKPSRTSPAEVASRTASGTEKPTNTGSGIGGGLDSAGKLTSNSHGVLGLEGLHLSTDATSATEGSLITSSGKSVHLDSGIRMLLVSE